MGRRIAVFLLLAATVVVGASFLGSRTPAQPNVLILTVDTLRADHLGCYGATRVATPHIDRIAREGALFDNAACPMPMTRPSLSTVHTSRYPREHGVVNNAVALPSDAVTLAEVLAQAGYATAGFTSVRLLDAESGLAQGFSTFFAPEAHQIDAGEIVPRALDWLGARDPARPFFVWLHLFDPHLPYAPPPQFVRGTGVDAVSWRSLLATAGENGGDVPARVLERALELYAGEVAYVDDWVGKVLAHLDALGVLDETVIVFTADHGECFDHGVFFEHADCLYDGAVRVPLLMRYPTRVAAGTRVAAQVEHLDVAPTILTLAGIAPAPAFRGHALLASATSDPPASSSPSFALIEHPLYQSRAAQLRRRKQDRIRSVGGMPTRQIVVDRPNSALRGEEWKVISNGPDTELYELREDPSEVHDVAAQKPEVTAELRRILDEKLAQHPLQLREPEAVNERLRETLRALGYIQ